MTPPNWLIVGAGFTGASAARRLAERGAGPVLVIDRRPHVAGNAHDARNAAGLLVHRYGPHIFHTNSTAVWDFLSRFTTWRSYEHRVLADLGDVRLPLPVNLTAIRMIDADQAEAIIARLQQRHGAEGKVALLTLLEAGDALTAPLARFVYDNIFLNYTRKQWGLRPEQLDRSVTARVPIRLSEDDRYFQDRHQAMPRDGFTALVARMLDHPDIRVELGVDHDDVPVAVREAKTVFTGPIDGYFGFAHGPLPYRSMRFTFETLAREQFQPVGTVNYPNAPDLTRITEFRHLTGDGGAITTIAREYPHAHVHGETEPDYPVPSADNAALYARYRRAAEPLKGRVWFAGRLGDYTYYNMDQAVARGLSLVDKELLA